MHNFKVSIEYARIPADDAPPAYRISIRPFSGRIGGSGTKDYSTGESLAEDLKRFFRFSDESAQRLIASLGKARAEIDYFPLSDEDASYYGWVPDYKRHGYRTTLRVASAQAADSSAADSEPAASQFFSSTGCSPLDVERG